eukprot:403332415
MKTGKQSATGNNGNLLVNLQRIQKQLDIELKDIERKIFQDETQYLKDSLQFGSITKGWDGTGNQQKSTIGHQGSRKTAKFTQMDRLFSYSSKTAPTTEEETKNFDSSGLTMHKLKGLTLGKQGKGGVFDKSLVRPSAKQSLIISSKNKNRRPKKPPGSLMDMSNDGGDDGAIANGVQEFLSDNDDPMKDDEEEEGSSNFMQEDSDN